MRQQSTQLTAYSSHRRRQRVRARVRPKSLYNARQTSRPGWRPFVAHVAGPRSRLLAQAKLCLQFQAGRAWPYRAYKLARKSGSSDTGPNPGGCGPARPSLGVGPAEQQVAQLPRLGHRLLRPKLARARPDPSGSRAPPSSLGA